VESEVKEKSVTWVGVNGVKNTDSLGMKLTIFLLN